MKRYLIQLIALCCLFGTQNIASAQDNDGNQQVPGSILPSGNNNAPSPTGGIQYTPPSTPLPVIESPLPPSEPLPPAAIQPTEARPPSPDFSGPPGLGAPRRRTMFPDKCMEKGFTYQDKLLVMQPQAGGKQVVYLIKNIKDYLVVLNRPSPNPIANEGWTSPLHPNNWSAFSLNQGDFSISCLQRRDTLIGYVSCQDVLKVCVYPPFEQNAGNGGTYWLGEDRSLQGLFDDLRERGFVLPLGTSAEKVIGEPPPGVYVPAGPYPGTPPIPATTRILPSQHKE